ncbi:aminomethyl-transferring glycine dehydrogenase subunit GcvPA [Jeotgalibaca sp. MA1X17-3]|uniref:aminomethyl-transferring glycine dehydrogenase subunit GcvPA n=1 Tax=Jeotgalibaca sp. MA1X17-3 TaxID=2908211 RepID=UPI001F225A4A|nr:aminomethyl-transferring glycine dehydrogenase subunit GcvPA [Jeotgalibaca sp. MA1X17-3]UJF16497.1 aminomethyl-transferring glycine dehydrogenase subunit GcvPA [Jeotgalibaca sp. MA1X17-3]
MDPEIFRYLPDTPEDIQVMLQVVGVESIKELFQTIPPEIRLKDNLEIPDSLSEYKLLQMMQKMAKKNISATEMPFFLGAGTYDHYIPSVVDAVISRSEFYTAYTPYQAEASQGELQAIFEFQSMISELTGMEVTNSSLYDGFTSLSEAVGLAQNVTKKNKVLLSMGIHPEGRSIVKTAAVGRGIEIEEIPLLKDCTDLEKLSKALTDEVAAVAIQYPNFLGTIEDIQAVKRLLEGTSIQLIVIANPLALGLLEAPGHLGADVVVGDTQSLGIPMSFGGPHCGYFSVTKKNIRRVPGRMVGETEDAKGNRGFVLALQVREQHIRREKATSYMSSNQALNALQSAVCMAALGRNGIQEIAQLNFNNASYLAEKLIEKGFSIYNDGPYFNEFVVELPIEAEKMNQQLLDVGIMGGYSLEKDYGMPMHMLLCATEKRSKQEMDRLVEALGGQKNDRK